jgi:hypothetical protein
VRTPLTIFALGLGACLALGLMMQHLVRVSKERNQPPLLQEINRRYGPRLDGEARLRFLPRRDGTLAEVTISPLLAGRDLAREVGQFVWRTVHDRPLAGVEVVCQDPLGNGTERVVVERPSAAALTPPALEAKRGANARPPVTGERAAPAAPRR